MSNVRKLIETKEVPKLAVVKWMGERTEQPVPNHSTAKPLKGKKKSKKKKNKFDHWNIPPQPEGYMRSRNHDLL